MPQQNEFTPQTQTVAPEGNPSRGLIEKIVNSRVGLQSLEDVLVSINNDELLAALSKPSVRESIVMSTRATKAVVWELARRMTGEPETSVKAEQLRQHFLFFNGRLVARRKADEQARKDITNNPTGENMELVNKLDRCMSGYIADFVSIRKTLEQYPVFSLSPATNPSFAQKVSAANEKYNAMMERFGEFRQSRGARKVLMTDNRSFPTHLAVIEAGFVLDAMHRNNQLEKAVFRMFFIDSGENDPFRMKPEYVQERKNEVGGRFIDGLVRLPSRVSPPEISSQMTQRVAEVMLSLLKTDDTLICSQQDIIRGLKRLSHEMAPGALDRMVINGLESGRIGFSPGVIELLEGMYGSRRKTIAAETAEMDSHSREFLPQKNFKDFAPLHPSDLLENRRRVANLLFEQSRYILSRPDMMRAGERSYQQFEGLLRNSGAGREQTVILLKDFLMSAKPEVKNAYYPFLHSLLSSDDVQWLWRQENNRAGAKNGSLTREEERFRETMIKYMSDKDIIAIGWDIVTDSQLPPKNRRNNIRIIDVEHILRRLTRDLDYLPPDAEPPTRSTARELAEVIPNLSPWSRVSEDLLAKVAGQPSNWSWERVSQYIESPELPTRLTLPVPKQENKEHVPVALQYFPRTSPDQKVHAANVAEFLIRRVPMEPESFVKHVSNTLPWVETRELLNRLEKPEVQSAIMASPRMMAIVGFELVNRRNSEQMEYQDAETIARIENLAVQFNNTLCARVKQEKSLQTQYQTGMSPELASEKNIRMQPGGMPRRNLSLE